MSIIAGSPYIPHHQPTSPGQAGHTTLTLEFDVESFPVDCSFALTSLRVRTLRSTTPSSVPFSIDSISEKMMRHSLSGERETAITNSIQ